MKNKAFTYLEVLMAVVILASALIPLLNQFYIGFKGNATAELISQAVGLSGDLVEEIKSRRFDENEYPNEPVPPAEFGVDSGEDANDRTTFDDVDDYHNWLKTPPEAIDGTVLNDFSEFSRSVTVEYVDVSGSDWVSSATATAYKKITVTVSHPSIGDRYLETIVSHF